MKRIVVLLLVLASLTCASSAFASIDLQIRNARFIDNSVTGIGQATGLYVYVQNNGTEDYQGTFLLKLWGESDIAFSYTGVIESENFCEIYLPIISAKKFYSIQVDARNDVAESNEDNNYISYSDGEPQIGIISNLLLARNYRDTLFVLPGEYFYQQFSLSELNSKKAIIGFDFKVNAYGFSEAQDFSFGVQSIYPQIDTTSGEMYDGKYSYKSTSYQDARAYSKWMANESSAARDYFWLGHFYGVARDFPVGSVAEMYININCATNNLQSYYYGFKKTIKAINRIRCDVNDDGVVDEADLNILMKVVDYNKYNPCWSFKNMYKERGMNYGAGIILFSVPDFVSNCLLNIWLNDKTDPLVQGLGIGEPMTDVTPGTVKSSVKSIANTYSITGENLTISAPGADLYNVTGQTSDGKVFQATGKIGERITVPLKATNIRVETVKVKQSLTNFTAPKKNFKFSAYPNPIIDNLNLKSAESGLVKVINLSGQTIFSAEVNSDEELQINSKSWTRGIYLVKIDSRSGKQTLKIVK